MFRSFVCFFGNLLFARSIFGNRKMRHADPRHKNSAKNAKNEVWLKWKFRFWRLILSKNHQNRSYPRVFLAMSKFDKKNVKKPGFYVLIGRKTRFLCTTVIGLKTRFLCTSGSMYSMPALIRQCHVSLSAARRLASKGRRTDWEVGNFMLGVTFWQPLESYF